MSRFSSAFTSGRRRTPRTRLKMAALAPIPRASVTMTVRSEEHTSELQSRLHLVCRLLLEKKKTNHLIPCCIYLFSIVAALLVALIYLPAALEYYPAITRIAAVIPVVCDGHLVRIELSTPR